MGLHTTIVLMPGLDGTGQLFDPLLARLPEGVQAEVVDYPRDRVLDNEALVALVEERVPAGQPHVVVAESFSGPIALQYVQRRQRDVQALVLSASFLRNPLPAPLRALPRAATAAMFALPMPDLAVRTFLVGFDAGDELLRRVQTAVARVEDEVLAARVRSLASLDVTDICGRLKTPTLYLLATDDQLVGNRGAEQLQQALPNSEIRSIDGPHLLLQTRPGEAMEAIETFLMANIFE